jgi:predicted dehydrogenase
VETPVPPRVLVLGEGAAAQRWAALLGQVARVRLQQEVAPAEADAVVLAPGAREPYRSARAALLSGAHVLSAAPFLLSPRQASDLDELSRALGRFLRYYEPYQYGRGFAFLKRLLRGREPLWRPLYLRALRSVADGFVTLDELAAGELALCQALLEAAPRRVNASAARDESGDARAVFATLEYEHGPPVQMTLSTAESAAAGEFVAVAPNVTLVLDDPVGRLRIVRRGEERTAGRASERPAPTDAVAAEAERFAEAVRSEDLSFANSARWTMVALLWWALRRSINLAEPVDMREAEAALNAMPPPLTVIEGGGRTAEPTGRPALSLVAG